VQQSQVAINKKSGELIDQIYSAARRGDTEKVKDLTNLYVDLTGKPVSGEAIENQMKEEFLSEVQKQQLKGKAPKALMNIARMNKLLESK